MRYANLAPFDRQYFGSFLFAHENRLHAGRSLA